MERLLKAMICPDHRKRLTASQGHRHTALQPQHNAEQMSTPPFVRTATGHHEHRAKRRREPQPKARPAKCQKVESSAPVEAKDGVSEADLRKGISPARNTPIRASDLLTPQKKPTNSKILIVTPKETRENLKEFSPGERVNDQSDKSPPLSMDPDMPQENPAGRPRINAMSTIEALGQEQIRIQHPKMEEEHRDKNMEKVKSFGRFCGRAFSIIPPP